MDCKLADLLARSLVHDNLSVHLFSYCILIPANEGQKAEIINAIRVMRCSTFADIVVEFSLRHI